MEVAGMATKVTRPADAADITAIEATLMLAVYRARRSARRQLAGLDPVPPASIEALHLYKRVEEFRRTGANA